MEKVLKYFLIVFAIAAVFLILSCRRETSVLAETEIINSEHYSEHDIVDPAVERITRFTPLNANERFAYSLERVRDNQGQQAWWNITLYAVRNNDINDVTELFTWRRYKLVSR